MRQRLRRRSVGIGCQAPRCQPFEGGAIVCQDAQTRAHRPPEELRLRRRGTVVRPAQRQDERVPGALGRRNWRHRRPIQRRGIMTSVPRRPGRVRAYVSAAVEARRPRYFRSLWRYHSLAAMRYRHQAHGFTGGDTSPLISEFRCKRTAVGEGSQPPGRDAHRAPGALTANLPHLAIDDVVASSLRARG